MDKRLMDKKTLVQSCHLKSFSLISSNHLSSMLQMYNIFFDFVKQVRGCLRKLVAKDFQFFAQAEKQGRVKS